MLFDFSNLLMSIFCYLVIANFMILFHLLRIPFYCTDNLTFVVVFQLALAQGSFISKHVSTTLI